MEHQFQSISSFNKEIKRLRFRISYLECKVLLVRLEGGDRFAWCQHVGPGVSVSVGYVWS